MNNILYVSNAEHTIDQNGEIDKEGQISLVDIVGLGIRRAWVKDILRITSCAHQIRDVYPVFLYFINYVADDTRKRNSFSALYRELSY